MGHIPHGCQTGQPRDGTQGKPRPGRAPALYCPPSGNETVPEKTGGDAMTQRRLETCATVLILCGAAAMAVQPPDAVAQEFPSRSIRLLVGVPARGSRGPPG